MKLKNIKRKLRKPLKIITITYKLGTGLFIIFICTLVILAAGLSMQNGLYDEVLVARVGLISIMLAIFPTMQQILKMIVNEKVEFTVTGKCPRCQTNYEMTMKEKSDTAT